MKKLLGVLHPFTVSVGIVLGLCSSPALPQSFYSLQHTNWPPLPFLPFDVPVYDFGDGIFGYDDLSVDYQQLQAVGSQMMMMGGLDEPPPPPGEGGGEGGATSKSRTPTITRPTICGSRLRS